MLSEHPTLLTGGPSMTGIGKHIIFDGDFRPDSPLATVGGGHRFLTDFVTALGMTIVIPPYVIEFPVSPSVYDRIKQTLKDAGLTHLDFYQELIRFDTVRNGAIKGISGIVGLAESHIAYHTAPEHVTDGLHFVSIDVYSCKPFDPSVTLNYLRQSGLVRGHVVEINRFVGGPQEVKTYPFD